MHECLEWYPAYNRGRLLFYLHKTLPRFKGRERLLNLLALRHKRRRLELINGRGIRVTINPLEHIGYAICAKNSFEPLSLSLAVRLMAGGGVFLDAGANFGLYSLSLAGIPGVRCLAVDALPQAVALLHEHRLLNPKASIEIFAVALSSFQGLVKFSGPHIGNFGTGRLDGAAESAALWVHTTTLQSVINTAGLPDINLMKMDVEGHEFEALLGMDFEASCAPSHLILEQESAFNDAAAIQKIWALLKGKGYDPFDVLGNPLAMNDQPLENNVWWTRERHSLPSC
jgi:FkbM family methyltransferase